MPKSTEKRDTELAALLEEVRSLKEDLDVLRRNPIIGEAVEAALAHARVVARTPDGARFPPNYAVAVRQLPPNYAVAVRDLPPTYAVAVRELPPTYAVAVRELPGRDVARPAARTTKARAAAKKPAAKKPAAKRGAAAGRKRAKPRKSK